jgi:hypothetical protein
MAILAFVWGSGLMPGSREDELESVVGRVKDVLRARVVRDDDGKVSEVRILTKDAKSAQKISRDVASVIRSQGEEVPPENIRVAQMTQDDWSSIAGTRLRLEGVGFETRTNRAEARTILALGKQEVVGSATGSPSAYESLRLVADATLNAVKMCLDPCPEVLVEGTSLITLAGVETVVVLVSMSGPDGVEVYSGSCPVRTDRRDAVARATLNAINRKVARIMKGAS